LRVAELGKHVGDYDTACADFLHVVKLCEQYPSKNEDTLTSSVFALGKLYLDKQQPEQANEWFQRALTSLMAKLKLQLSQSGAEPTDCPKKLLEESIFDTDQIKATKALV
jgi:tetratricopeptide (TPR) repeat protein